MGIQENIGNIINSVKSELMKYTVLLVLLYVSTCYGQTSDTTFIHGDSLKISNIQIFDSWDYHVGDDTTWADPAFSSVGWKLVNSRLHIDSVKEDEWTGIAWLRKTIAIDSSLMNKTIAITLNHYGASELYYNGKSLNKYGTVSDNYEKEEIYYSNSKPILIHFDSSSTYNLTVRYSNHLPQKFPYLYERHRGHIGFYATFKDWNRGLNYFAIERPERTIWWVLFLGIFLSISVINLLLFLFFKKNREYLYYAIFTLTLSAMFINVSAEMLVTSNVYFYLVRSLFTPILFFTAFLSVLAFLYHIFYGKMLKLFKYLFFLSLVAYIAELVVRSSDIGRMTAFSIIFISAIEIIRVIFLAVKQKKNNAWVLGIGLLLFATLIISTFVVNIFGTGDPGQAYGIILLFSIPLSMSIYLARNSSQTNKNLEIQLDNVQKLSKKAIEQEKKTARLEMESQIVKLENERKSKELEEARQLQLSMLPKTIPSVENLDIAVYMKTATEVGGDYYDFQVDDDGSLLVALGDATGHGMQAGTLVTLIKGLFTSEASNKGILKYFKDASKTIKEINLGRLMMAFSLLKIKGNRLEFSNAGLPPMYIYRRGVKKVEEIDMQGMPLGAMKNFSYKLYESKLSEGDCILLLSDGYPELANADNEQIGYERLQNQLLKIANDKPEEIIKYFKNFCSEWVNDKDPDDDVTFVVIKVK